MIGVSCVCVAAVTVRSKSGSAEGAPRRGVMGLADGLYDALIGPSASRGPATGAGESPPASSVPTPTDAAGRRRSSVRGAVPLTPPTESDTPGAAVRRRCVPGCLLGHDMSARYMALTRSASVCARSSVGKAAILQSHRRSSLVPPEQPEACDGAEVDEDDDGEGHVQEKDGLRHASHISPWAVTLIVLLVAMIVFVEVDLRPLVDVHDRVRQLVHERVLGGVMRFLGHILPLDGNFIVTAH
jgi:hypothetical protein